MNCDNKEGRRQKEESESRVATRGRVCVFGQVTVEETSYSTTSTAAAAAGLDSSVNIISNILIHANVQRHYGLPIAQCCLVLFADRSTLLLLIGIISSHDSTERGRKAAIK